MRYRNGARCAGIALCVTGAIIVLALLLPSCAWWFLLAAVLMISGMCLLFKK